MNRALLLAACVTAAPLSAQNRPAQTPPQAPAGAPATQTTPAQRPDGGPRPYRDVITAAMQSDSGVFLVHRQADRLFYEIPRAMFGREFILIADQRGTVRGVGYAGEEVSRRTLRWERLGNRVLLRAVNWNMRADSTRPVARAVALSNQAPILMSFDIASWSPDDSNAVIEVTRLFTTDVAEIGMRQVNGLRVRRLDPARSVLERARSFPRNIEVSAYHTYEVDSIPGAPGSPADRSLNSMTILMNWSMQLLPDQPMMARRCDDRVGYFAFTTEDFTINDGGAETRCYIQRFRLEARNPNAAVSDPIEPITFYIDPATPEKWVQPLIRGVEMWEPVFRAAGFSNAIRARRAPTPEEDPEFDLDDARYSTIRWLPSSIANAYGPRVWDPRTGQILQANIGWFQEVIDFFAGYRWVLTAAIDPAARELPLNDSIVAELVQYVSAHEVGHTIGLLHDHMGNAYYPVDSLRSRSFTCRMGTTASIMDYARYNYVAQPGDNVCLAPRMGPYDFFAIEFGYRRVPGATTPDAERRFLDSLARRQDSEPWLRFAQDFDPTDPRWVPEAVGDDPVRASELGLANLRRLMPLLLPQTTKDRTENFEYLREMYQQVTGQWNRLMGHVAIVVGGVYRDRRYPSQPGVIYTPVPRERQAAAVQFLLANAFVPPRDFLDAGILRRLEATGSVERWRQAQTGLLNTMLQDVKLSRLAEASAFATPAAPAYAIGDLFSDLRRGLFSEAAAPRPVTDEFRRNIQRAYVDQLERIVTTPLQVGAGTPRPADARALARATMRELDTQLRTALIRTTDATTRAHFEDVRARIDRVLNPR